MTPADFTTTITVDCSPEEVFKAITDPRRWWSEEIEGNTEKLNDEFSYHFEDVHKARIRLTGVIPGKKVEWLVISNYFKFTKDTTEWTGTRISFDIAMHEGKTHMTFTHHGLTPEYECFEVCHKAWTQYIQKSLKELITTGKGQPNTSGRPMTEDERSLSASGK